MQHANPSITRTGTLLFWNKVRTKPNSYKRVMRVPGFTASLLI
jgi:hypothetical protein